MKLKYTRAMLRAALEGKLDEVATEKDPIFGLEIPLECPDVPSEVLKPRDTWTDGAAYDEQARKLAAMFKENFEKYADGVPEEVRAGRTALARRTARQPRPRRANASATVGGSRSPMNRNTGTSPSSTG